MKQKVNANSLTNAIVDYLNHKGYVVWRSNTVGIYDPVKKIYRKNPKTRKGISDICGFSKEDGKFIGIEIKVGYDKLSQDQIYFREDVLSAGGIYIVAHDLDSFMNEFEKL